MLLHVVIYAARIVLEHDFSPAPLHVLTEK
jgi:hypothetical protein